MNNSFNLSNLGNTIINNNDAPIKNENFCLNDFNNFEGSSRKLVVNNSLEFWVHDELLIKKSLFFKIILEKDFNLNNSLKSNFNCNNANINTNKESYLNKVLCNFNDSSIKFHDNIKNNIINSNVIDEVVIINNKNILKTSINLPISDLFFDILIWFYSNDYERLNDTVEDVEALLSLIALGNFLCLENCFFQYLLSNISFKIDSNFVNSSNFYLFNIELIDFESLKIILDIIKEDNINFDTKCNNYFICYILLSWLNNYYEEILNINKSNKKLKYTNLCELLISEEAYIVKNTIIGYNIVNSLNINELYDLYSLFTIFSELFNFKELFNKFIDNNSNQITFKFYCIICKNYFNSINDAKINKCYYNYMYHPGEYEILHIKLSEYPEKCLFKGCDNKYSINQFTCCHGSFSSIGCASSNGVHIFSIVDSNKKHISNTNSINKKLSTNTSLSKL